MIPAPRMSLGANDLLPCGTPTAYRRHVALAERCITCGTDGRTEPRPSLADIVAGYRQAAAVLRAAA